MNSDPKIINNFDDLFPIPNRSASKICSNRHSADGDGTRGRPMAPRGGGALKGQHFRWNTSFLFKWPIFRCYVNFRECNDWRLVPKDITVMTHDSSTPIHLGVLLKVHFMILIDSQEDECNQIWQNLTGEVTKVETGNTRSIHHQDHLRTMNFQSPKGQIPTCQTS